MKKVLTIATVIAAFISATPASAETITASLTSPSAERALARGEQVCTTWSTHNNRMCAKRIGGKDVFDFQRTPTTIVVVEVNSRDCVADLMSENCMDDVAIAAVKATERKALYRR